MTTLEIQALNPVPRIWESDKGPVPFIQVKFTDGRVGEVRTTKDAEPKRRAELEAILGKPGEFVVEDGGTWNDGKPRPLKIKDYPGKPKGKQGEVAWRNTKEGQEYEQAKIDHRQYLSQRATDRRASLSQAIESFGVGPVERVVTEQDVLTTAERYFNWLRHIYGERPLEQETSPSPVTSQTPGMVGMSPPSSPGVSTSDPGPARVSGTTGGNRPEVGPGSGSTSTPERAGSGGVTTAGAEGDVQGEGATPAPAADEQSLREAAWQELEQIAGGSHSRARSMVNRFAKASYTQATEDEVPVDTLLACIKEHLLNPSEAS